MVAPVLNSAQTPTLGTLLEGATNPSGVTVASLVVDGSITDADGAVEAIAIEALDTSLGTWQYSLDAGTTWLTVRSDLLNNTTNTLGLLLGPTNKIRLLPYGDLNGSVTNAITFRAWDMSTGTAGSYVVTTPGTGAFSTASDTASIAVTAVNDAPTFSPVRGGGTAIIPVGTLSDIATSVTVQPDGKIILGGGSTSDFSIVRLNANGSLDTGFGVNGKAIIDVGTSSDFANSVTVQPDGKIILVGYSFIPATGTYDFSLIRLNTNGSLDTGFGVNGKAIIPVGPSDDLAYSVTVQPDGKIILGGRSYNGANYEFSIIRLNANGSLDTSFDGDGKAIIDVGASTDQAFSVTVQPDGKIILGGYTYNPATGIYDFSLIRLNANGSLDTSFDGDGKSIIDLGPSDDLAYSVTVQPDGKIILGGHSYNGANYDFSIIRLNANGSLDTSFDGDGKAIIPVGTSTDFAYSVTLQPDGKIILGGYSFNGTTNDFSIIRLNADGSLDRSFDGDGKVIIPVGTSDDLAASVTVQPDGKIILGGYSFIPATGAYDFSLIRLNTDGSLDQAFNGTALDTLGGIASYTENTAAIALDSSVQVYDADLVALNNGAGNYSGSSITLQRQGGASSEDIFSARGNLVLNATNRVLLSDVDIGSYTNASGTLAITFGANATQGRVNEAISSIGYANSSDAPPSSVTISWTFSDGNTGVQGAGAAQTATGATTVNITAVNDAPALNASVSPSAGSVLEGATNPSGVTVASLVVDGSITDADGAVEAIAIEALDTSLGTWQYSLDNGTTWLTVRSDLLNNTTNTLGLLLGPTDKIRLLPYGDLNGSLANAITFRAWDMSTGTAGSYVVTTPGTGAFSTASDTASIAVTAVNDAPTFSPVRGGGTAIIPVGTSFDEARSVTVQPDGKIILGGYSFIPATGTYDFSIVRLNANGSLDTSFDGDGKSIIPVGTSSDHAYSVTLQPDGKIILGGSSFNVINDDFSIVRLNANGSLDTSFDGDGKSIIPVGISSDQAYSVTVQPDGKIILGGLSGNGTNYDFSLIRLNANGSLDDTFDGDGKAIISVGTSNDYGWSVTLQPDGKIILGGFSFIPATGTYDFSIVRLNANGSLDTGFGVNGKAIIDVGTSTDIATSVTVQPDGKIILGGYSYNPATRAYDFSIVRLNANGSLDTSFDGDGKAIIPVGTSTDAGPTVTVQPDGKIILGGFSYNSAYEANFNVIRLNADGALDTSFGVNGRAIIPSENSGDVGYSVTVQPDGKIILGGQSYNSANGTYDFSIVRLNADGSLDQAFNGTALDTLGGIASYTENTAAIALDSSVQVYDADLAALNNGAGNYAGSSVTLQRQGGASSEDVFSARGNLVLNATNRVLLSGVDIGSYTNASGTLAITFGANATQARVNEAISSIGYANTSDAPPASVTIAWTFSDGNTGVQGAGAAQTATGATTVNITAVNDAPSISTFQPQTQYTTGYSPRSVTVADFNGDGKADLAAANMSSDAVSVLLGNGDGTFQIPTLYATGYYPYSVTVGEFNGDGKEDVAVVNNEGSSVSVLLGNGDGTFQAQTSYDTGSFPSSITIGDFNADGRVDLAVASDEGTVSVLLGNGNGTFQPHIQYALGSIPLSVTAGDFNGDGQADLAAANFGSNTVSVLLGNGDGTFQAQTQYATGSAPNSVTVADFNDDGQVDIAAANYSSNTVSVLMGNGNGTFQAQTQHATGSAPYSVTVGDFNDDGQIDIAAANLRSNTISVLLGNGDGTFQAQTQYATGSLPVSITVADFNGDGQADLAAANFPNHTISVLVNSSVAMVTENVPTSTAVYTVVANDPDAGASLSYSIVGGADAERFDINSNTGAVSFKTSPNFEAPADADSDNIYDIIVQASDGSLTAQKSVTIKVIDVNDAPALNDTHNPSFGNLLEGATNPSGVTVASLVVDGSITDADGAVEAIAIEALDTSLGTWQYSLDNGTTWLTARSDLLNNTTNTLGLLLGPTDKIRLLPYGDLNGSLANAIIYRAWDMSTGTAGSYVVTTPGAGAFSTASDTASIAVTAVNDAPTFSPVQGGGSAIIDVGTSNDLARSVTVQPDGKIILGGQSYNGANYDFSIIRLNANGTLDTSFNFGGKQIIDYGASQDLGFSIALQPDGKIIIAGSRDYNFSLIRLNDNGSLDTSFGFGGGQIIHVGTSYDYAYSVTVQPDGKIILGGDSFNPDTEGSDFSIVRLNADGSLDTSFDGDGKAIIDVGTFSDDSAYSVTVQPDGKIILGGYSINGATNDFSIVRLNGDGSLDENFGIDGKAIIPVGTSH